MTLRPRSPRSGPQRVRSPVVRAARPQFRAARRPSRPGSSRSPSPVMCISPAGSRPGWRPTRPRCSRQAVPALSKADLTMVNLETAITTGGEQQDKSFTFRAPPTAFTALRDAGIDVATDGKQPRRRLRPQRPARHAGRDRASKFPVIGIGTNAARHSRRTRRPSTACKVAIFAADQVQDETAGQLFSPARTTPASPTRSRRSCSPPCARPRPPATW